MAIRSSKKTLLTGLVFLIVFALFVGGCNKAQKEKEQTSSEESQGAPEQAQQQAPPGMSTPPTAATDVGDEELKLFSELFQKTQEIQNTIQQDMQNTITSTGMTLERYSEIMRQMQNQAPGTPPSISAEEQAKLGEVQQKLQQLQMEAQQKMIGIVQDGGMTIERFQSILMAMRTDQELQQRMQGYIQQP